jgi:hypothetical protein
MHRIMLFSRVVLPALALAALIGHVKFGFTPLGFSSGR